MLRALILGGGHGLGSYLAGAYEGLHEAGETPDWVAGTSIGAVTAGLIAGNAPERRLDSLQAFWAEASGPDWLLWPPGESWRNAVQTRLFGRPSLFHPKLQLLSAEPCSVGVYNIDQMRRLLETLIDFDRLNAGGMRFSVLSVDLETGEEVVFDNTATRITVDHIMASAALLPDFPPVRIGNRWLVDGGMAANVPVDLVLGDPPDQDMLCFLLDLFPADGTLPRDLAGMVMRQSDLIFACQTERSLRAWEARHVIARHRIDIVRTSYAAGQETAVKSWDFSKAALSRRWNAGRADIRAAWQRFQGLRAGGPGLVIHPVVRA